MKRKQDILALIAMIMLVVVTGLCGNLRADLVGVPACSSQVPLGQTCISK